MRNLLLILVLILVVSCTVEPQDQRARILEELKVVGDDIQNPGTFHVVIEGNNRDFVEREQNDTKAGFHKDFSNEAKFMPNNIEITLGDTVIWTNKDGIEHTVTFQNEFDEKLPKGGIAQREFTKTGFYPYYSRYQPKVKGIVVVS